MLIIIILFVLCFWIGAFFSVYLMGIRYINEKFEKTSSLILAHIFFFITFLPLLLFYAIFLSIDSSKKTKHIKNMALDKDIKYEDFLVVFNKNILLFNIFERRTLLDMAFQVRNSK